MAQYPEIESIGSKGSIVLGFLAVQVLTDSTTIAGAMLSAFFRIGYTTMRGYVQLRRKYMSLDVCVCLYAGIY